MKIKTSGISALVLVVASLLGGAVVAQAETAITAIFRCPEIPELKIDKHLLYYSGDEPICVRPGGQFKINLLPLNNFPIVPADIDIEQKTGYHPISKVTVAGNNVLIGKVSSSHQVGKKPEFMISVKHVGELDPRVRIIPNFRIIDGFNEQERNRLEGIEDHLLANYSIPLAGLLEIEAYLEDKGTKRTVDQRAEPHEADLETARREDAPRTGYLRGLSTKLLALTIVFIMLGEVLIFVPSIAKFRIDWLQDRLSSAKIAALVLEAAPDGMVPDKLRNQVLESAGAVAVAVKRGEQRSLLLKPNTKSVRKLRTSGALQAMLIWVFWFGVSIQIL